MNETNHSQLKEFLDEHEIPFYEKAPKTFLEIAKQPHYENVISNIYAFFFNVHEEHGIKDLFIRSLIACIDETKIKGKDFSVFTDFNIDTEYPTKGKGKFGRKGRIDILLHNDQQAIIIENKIYHTLDNDLDDYWNSVQILTENTSSKIGVILSIKPISEDLYKQFDSKEHYINITHAALMKKVKEQSTSYFIEVKENYVHFFNDFYQNIMNLSSTVMNRDHINFYVENKEKINKLVLFKNQFKTHIISEVDNAGLSLNDVNLIVPRNKFNAKRLRYYQSKKNKELVYTIVFEELLKQGGILHIIVEPREKTLKNGVIFKNIEFDEHEKLILRSDFYEKTNQPWAHFASKPYQLEVDDIANLSNFIQEKIYHDGFASIMAKMENYTRILQVSRI